MRRRTFLQHTAAGLGMIAVPSFLLKNGKAFAVPPGTPGAVVADNLNGTYFAEAFGLDENITCVRFVHGLLTLPRLSVVTNYAGMTPAPPMATQPDAPVTFVTVTHSP